ncbi:type 4a pilus biogenesis protein PilO [Desulfobacula sp.]|uniref:type 4a pilus biogenesis protein PilO n=1 Tax=Desulfobacula sp. TaxID=2593537 RepID=UPI0026267E6C|nr:type 4a pilus biogenesis protein PilO [Desulfobacula sp.]
MNRGKNKINETKKKLRAFSEKVGALTKVQRLLICVVTFAVIGGAYYYFVFMPKHEELENVKKNYESQLNVLSTYKRRAAEIVKYEKLMAEAQEEFNLAMKALPDKRELPSLLTGISKAGSDAGLEFHLFQPANEVSKEFYKEIPVSIKVEGRYHQLTDFFFQIIGLNRIVNINNVDVKSKKDGKILEMNCKAVTYMFVEKKEPVDKNKRKRKKK